MKSCHEQMITTAKAVVRTSEQRVWDLQNELEKAKADVSKLKSKKLARVNNVYYVNDVK